MLVDVDEFAGQPAEARVLGDLGLQRGSGGGRDGAGGAFAVDLAEQQPVGAVPAGPLGGAAASA